MSAIRPLEATDAAAIFAAVDCSRDALRRWMSWYTDAYALDDARTWLEHALPERDAGRSAHFAVDEDATLVGVIGFEDIGSPPGSAMIGYWLATPATGRGTGKRAIRDALSWARRHTDLRLVWAIVAEPNTASRRVLEANGFQVARTADTSHSGDAQLIYELSLGADADTAESVSLDAAIESDGPLLANLLELYIHDLSAVFSELEIGADGRFGYRRLPLYWSDPGQRLPFLIRASGRLAGFALVQRRSTTDAATQRYDLAEFFVLRRYRRRGVGRQAASLLWERLPGQWTVRVAEDNRNALAFWRPVIESFANGRVTESTSVQDARDWRTFAFESDSQLLPTSDDQ